MNEFEMTEKLAAKENVSFESARDALRACSGDLVDAVVLLERKNREEEADTAKKTEEITVRSSEKTGRNNQKIKNFFGKVKDFLLHNSLNVSHNGEEVFMIPAWLLAILLAVNFPICAGAFIIGLFLDCRYAFQGKNNLSSANEYMDKAGDIADQVKAEFC